jgi:hypothetical protein
MASLIIGTSIFAYLKHKEHKTKKAAALASASSEHDRLTGAAQLSLNTANAKRDVVPRYSSVAESAPPAYAAEAGWEKGEDRRRSERERANQVGYYAQ